MSIDYPDWTVPQAHANAISVTGVPLLTAKALLGTGTQVVGPGSLVTVGPWNIDQPSYEMQLTAYQSGAGATGPLGVFINWNDSSGPFTVAQELWYIWPGVAINDHIVYGRGPSKADSVNLQLFNRSTVMQYSVFYRVLQSSRLFSKDDLRSVVYLTTSSGSPVTAGDGRTELLGYRSVSVAASGTDVTELLLYEGPVQLYADTGSNTTDFTFTIQDSAYPEGEGLGSRRWRAKSDANGFIVAQLALPRYQCRIAMTNGNAAAKFLTYSISAIDT